MITVHVFSARIPHGKAQYTVVKGSDSNFEVNIFQFLKVATNETST